MSNAMQPSTIRHDIATALIAIEKEMRGLGMWETHPPAPACLMSEIPFCHDTLEFRQWLQWIFIPRFRAVLEGNHPLPSASAIAPIAEEALLLVDGDTGALLAQVLLIDRLIGARAANPAS